MRGQLSVEARQRQVITRLKNENKKLREENKVLKEKVTLLEAQVETMSLPIKELQTIIFGKKKNKGGGSNINLSDPSIKKPRDNASFRRAVPLETEITKEETYHIDTCPECGSFLIKKYFVIRYLEDILLPYLDKLSGLIRALGKEVIREHIEKGYCPKCRCWHNAKTSSQTNSGLPARNNNVFLGPNIKLFVNFKTYVIRETVTQIQDELSGLYNLSISKGEIINMLDRTAEDLAPEYQRLLKRVQASPAIHMDETGWYTKDEKTFAWVMTPTSSEEAIFTVGRTRGKGVAEELLGTNYQGIIISDCYSAYKNLAKWHQVCWAHIIRKARDLAQNQSLESAKRLFSEKIYHELQRIYHELKVAIPKGTDKQESVLILRTKITNIIRTILKFKAAPKKLTDLAKLMNKYLNELFTCLKHDNVPAENNKAEQKLRQLVLKRKNSFGTKTDKGSETFSVNASVILSLWWQNKTGFWPNLRELAG